METEVRTESKLWPCVTHSWDSCPGAGSLGLYGDKHCTACHHLYTGSVMLCPLHNAAPELLAEVIIARDAVATALLIVSKGATYEWANLAEDLHLRLSEVVAKARGGAVS